MDFQEPKRFQGLNSLKNTKMAFWGEMAIKNNWFEGGSI